MNQLLTDPLLIGTFIVMGLSLFGMLAIPILPGQFIIWLTTLIYALIAGWSILGWGTFIVLTALMLLAALLDGLAGWFGAKAGGAGWKSILVGFVLAALGMIFFNLPGAIIGALIGIAAVEYRENKDWKQSLKAAGGYIAGFLGSIAIRFFIAALMILIFTVRVF